MITAYAATFGHWQGWQQAYRFGVLLIFPPEPLLTQVNTLRARYDPPSQAACDAHISLTIPLPRPLYASDWQELAAITAAITPFAIHYGPLMNYLPQPGINLAIEPQDPLDKLRVALESASLFAGASPRNYPFSAHMTIAELITVAETQALMAALAESAPQGSFPCTAVAYAVPDDNFHFTERKRLALAGHG